MASAKRDEAASRPAGTEQLLRPPQLLLLANDCVDEAPADARGVAERTATSESLPTLPRPSSPPQDEPCRSREVPPPRSPQPDLFLLRPAAHSEAAASQLRTPPSAATPAAEAVATQPLAMPPAMPSAMPSAMLTGAEAGGGAPGTARRCSHGGRPAARRAPSKSRI